MKQAILKPTLAVLLLIALLAGCNKHQDITKPGIKGTVTSSIKHKNLDGTELLMAPVEAFSQVVNDGSMKVVVVPDDIFAIGVAASVADEQLVEATVVNGVLSVSYSDENGVDNENNIVYVHSPIIDKLTMARRGTVESAGFYNRLDLDMRGKGKMILTGGIHTLNILAGGQGEVDAQGMPAIDVIVSGKSNGIVRVAPANSLRVDLNGGIKVYYTGTPTVTQRLRNGAQLIQQ